MKILQSSNFFYMLGGGSRYFFEVSKLLKKKGHDVAFFSMQDQKNYRSEWSKFFVSNVSFEKVIIRNGIRVIPRMLYSFEAKRKINRLLDEFQPNIVHLHDIYHHISPSIIPEIKKRNIPIVQNLGDYHLIAPNHNLYHNGSICEITRPKKYYKAIYHKCVKESYLASIAEVVEKYVHDWLGWGSNFVDFFIVPSTFMHNKLIEYGIAPEKIIHLPHFIDQYYFRRKIYLGSYILYFGRLSPEKGLELLVEVMKNLPHITLKIAGRGPLEKKLINKIKIAGIKNVELVGFQDTFALKKLIKLSKFTVLPSQWYEVFGLSILESFAAGKPVIASRIGGIPEIIQDGFNGFLFESNKSKDCKGKIEKLWNDPTLCQKMGRNAYEFVRNQFNPNDHYEKLISIYKKAIELHQ